MPEDQIAFRLLALYQKLRRATDPQVRAALKGNIDALLTELEQIHRAQGHANPGKSQPERLRSRR